MWKLLEIAPRSQVVLAGCLIVNQVGRETKSSVDEDDKH